MKISIAAKRYAKAIYEIAKSNNQFEAIKSELSLVVSAITSNTDVQQFLESPVVSPETKKELFKKSFGDKTSANISGLFSLMADKGRLEILPLVLKEFISLSDEEMGLKRGIVRSAKAVSSTEKAALEKAISKSTGKKVVLEYVEDKNVVAGVQAQVGGWSFDDSVRSHLTRLNEELNRRS